MDSLARNYVRVQANDTFSRADNSCRLIPSREPMQGNENGDLGYAVDESDSDDFESTGSNTPIIDSVKEASAIRSHGKDKEKAISTQDLLQSCPQVSLNGPNMSSKNKGTSMKNNHWYPKTSPRICEEDAYEEESKVAKDSKHGFQSRSIHPQQPHKHELKKLPSHEDIGNMDMTNSHFVPHGRASRNCSQHAMEKTNQIEIQNIEEGKKAGRDSNHRNGTSTSQQKSVENVNRAANWTRPSKFNNNNSNVVKARQQENPCIDSGIPEDGKLSNENQGRLTNIHNMPHGAMELQNSNTRRLNNSQPNKNSNSHVNRSNSEEKNLNEIDSTSTHDDNEIVDDGDGGGYSGARFDRYSPQSFNQRQYTCRRGDDARVNGYGSEYRGNYDSDYPAHHNQQCGAGAKSSGYYGYGSQKFYNRGYNIEYEGSSCGRGRHPHEDQYAYKDVDQRTVDYRDDRGHRYGSGFVDECERPGYLLRGRHRHRGHCEDKCTNEWYAKPCKSYMGRQQNRLVPKGNCMLTPRYGYARLDGTGLGRGNQRRLENRFATAHGALPGNAFRNRCGSRYGSRCGSRPGSRHFSRHGSRLGSRNSSRCGSGHCSRHSSRLGSRLGSRDLSLSGRGAGELGGYGGSRHGSRPGSRAGSFDGCDSKYSQSSSTPCGSWKAEGTAGHVNKPYPANWRTFGRRPPGMNEFRPLGEVRTKNVRPAGRPVFRVRESDEKAKPGSRISKSDLWDICYGLAKPIRDQWTQPLPYGAEVTRTGDIDPCFRPSRGDLVVVNPAQNFYRAMKTGYILTYTGMDYTFGVGDLIVRLGRFSPRSGKYVPYANLELYMHTESRESRFLGRQPPLTVDFNYYNLDYESPGKYLEIGTFLNERFYPRRGDIIIRGGAWAESFPNVARKYHSYVKYWIPHMEFLPNDMLVRPYVDIGKAMKNTDFYWGAAEFYTYSGKGLGWAYWGRDEHIFDTPFHCEKEHGIKTGHYKNETGHYQ